MRILYHIPNPQGLGADRWIYQGWKNAFLDLGHQFFELTEADNPERTLRVVRPDIFWTAYNLIDVVKHKDTLKRIRADGVRIFMRMDWPRLPEEIQVIRDEPIVDVYFDEREPESMLEFEKQTGRKFYYVPNAADKLMHFPVQPAAKFQYDVVYLGTNLPLKRWFAENVLLPLKKRYRVGLFGPSWTITDNCLRAAAKCCRTIGFGSAMHFCNDLRISVRPEEEKLLYSSAKICLNYHEREPNGSQPHYIVNQRTFKIPACGGFEICDNVPAIRKHFNEDEMVLAGPRDAKDWFDKIDYYLTHEHQRREIAARAAQRALKDHTYHNRVAYILSLYKELIHQNFCGANATSEKSVYEYNCKSR
jgi:hypothetical protein